MKKILVCLLASLSVQAASVSYLFNTSDSRENAVACLEDWKPHGVDSRWKCINGLLQSYSPNAGIKLIKYLFTNGRFSFDVNRRLGGSNTGRGETVVWLRNGTDSLGNMQRIRVVLEEQKGLQTTVRIEDVREGIAPKVLNHRVISKYTGRYVVTLQGNRVRVETNDGPVEAVTSILGDGRIYFFSSPGEGAWTDYDNLSLITYL